MFIASLRVATRSHLKIALALTAVMALGVGAAPVYGATVSSASTSQSPGAMQKTCFGVPATIVGERGKTTVGTDGDDVIYANGGKVFGLAGDDLICGYADGANGGPGDDRIQAFYQGVAYHGGPGDDTLYGSGRFDQSDFVYLNGDAGQDRLIGRAAGEQLNGGAGRDVMRGGPSVDLLKGKAGNDRLNGGDGNDRMNGGDGRDHCVDAKKLVQCETGDAA